MRIQWCSEGRAIHKTLQFVINNGVFRPPTSLFRIRHAFEDVRFTHWTDIRFHVTYSSLQKLFREGERCGTPALRFVGVLPHKVLDTLKS